jgi:hypothetical protein
MKLDLASRPFSAILVTRPFNVKTAQTFKMADVKISRLWELTIEIIDKGQIPLTGAL